MRAMLLTALLVSSSVAGFLQGLRTYLLQRKQIHDRLQEAGDAPRPLDDTSHEAESATTNDPAHGQTPASHDDAPPASVTVQEAIALGRFDEAEALLEKGLGGTVQERARLRSKIALFSSLFADVQADELADGVGVEEFKLADGRVLYGRTLRETESGRMIRLGNGTQLLVTGKEIVSHRTLERETYREALRRRIEGDLGLAGNSTLALFRVARFAWSHAFFQKAAETLEKSLSLPQSSVVVATFGDKAALDHWQRAYERKAPSVTVPILMATEPSAVEVAESGGSLRRRDSMLLLFNEGRYRYREAYRNGDGEGLREAASKLRKTRDLIMKRLEEDPENQELLELAQQVQTLLLDINLLTPMLE